MSVILSTHLNREFTLFIFLNFKNNKIFQIFEIQVFTYQKAQNTYFAEYVINRDGDVTVFVVLARKGGLYAEYFNNAFLEGIPALTRVDSKLNFTEWHDGLITAESGDFVSAHWYGKLLAPATEDFTFILNGDDGFRFIWQGQVLIDRWDTCCDEMSVTIALVQGTFYDLTVQFKEL